LSPLMSILIPVALELPKDIRAATR